MVRWTNRSQSVTTPSTPTPIVWLASYPKCGNTWVRFLLYAVLHGPPENSIEVTRKIPDLHRPLPFDPPDGPFLPVKTHLMLTDRHPKLDETARAVHVIRNPRDVALSALNYRRLATGDPKAIDAPAYLRSFIRAGGDAAWLRQGFGTWATHAASWRMTDRFPVLPVRYEDLKANPRAALVAMLGFLDIDADDATIDAAVKAASFESMRAMEIREKQKKTKDANTTRLFVGDPNATRQGIYFINKGASGQSLDAVAPGLDAEFDHTFAEQAARFGYGPA
jgi:hypothetical protein